MARTTTTSTSGREARKADRTVASNRRARHEFFIDEVLETGIALTGTEIKSVRDGKVTLTEAYVRVEHNELWLIGAHIAPYTHGNRSNHDPDRPRKLLAHKRQIRELREHTEQRGMTLVPLSVRLKAGRAKVDVGLARGKKLFDKRASEAEREGKRDIERAMRDRGDY